MSNKPSRSNGWYKLWIEVNPHQWKHESGLLVAIDIDQSGIFSRPLNLDQWVSTADNVPVHVIRSRLNELMQEARDVYLFAEKRKRSYESRKLKKLAE